jgi:tetratricopeptide (TPR) repeat protein
LKLGRVEEGLAAYEQLLIDTQRSLGADHPDPLNARNDLATALLELGRVEEALAALEQVLADERRSSAPTTPSGRSAPVTATNEA